MAITKIQKEIKFSKCVNPQTIATSTKTGTYYSLAKSHEALFVLVIGAVTAAVTCALWQTDGTTPKTISGKTAAIGTADANSVKFIEVDASELDVANGYYQVAIKMVAGGAGAIAGCILVRKPLRFEPASLVT